MATGSEISNILSDEREQALILQLETCLTANGYSGSEITQVQPVYTDLFLQSDIDEMAVLAQELLTDSEDKLNDAAEAYAVSERSVNNGISKASKSPDVQDAPRPIVKPEPKVIGASVTSVKDLDDASSDPSDSYPNTVLNVFADGGFLKVDTTSGAYEIVHPSGTSYKIDKTGNVTHHVLGSYKLVVEKDFAIDVRGNHDLIVSGNTAFSLRGTFKSIVTGAIELTSSAIASIQATLIKLN